MCSILTSRLHQRFPGLDIAIVSHGNEQFALTKSNQSNFSSLHQQVSLLDQSGVDVHVCGTYASWRDLKAEDFPAYVQVASSGPAKVTEYLDLGYYLVDELGVQ